MKTYKNLSKLKHLFLPRGRNPREIKTGLFKGLKFDLDFQCDSQLYFGFFEREISGWVKKLSNNINTAIDIGVAYGEYTLFFLRNTKTKKIFAFDPSEETRSFLIRNLKLNGYDNDPRFILISKFLGCDNNTTRLDSIVSEIIEPCLIKMDVDGAELDILKGSQKILSLLKCSWVIETHSKELENDCIKLLNEANYKTMTIRNAWWRIIIPEQRPIKHNRWLVAFKD